MASGSGRTRRAASTNCSRIRKTVVEGYRTTESFAGLCDEKGIDAPILREMNAILFAERRPADALAALMSRGLKDETDFGDEVTRPGMEKTRRRLWRHRQVRAC